MNRTPHTNHTSPTNRRRAFTALEALVMLLALFILTMLGIGLWLKKDKDDKDANSPAPQNTPDIIKPEIIDPGKESTPEKPEIETEQQPASEAAKPNVNS